MFEGKKVLVIDDEFFVCKSIEKILGQEKAHTDIAMSGKEGLIKARAEKYDLVLVDVKMPEMNGYAVVRMIRDIQPDIPVVVISGYNSSHTAEQAMLCGGCEFIAKPFTPDELMSAVNKYLSGEWSGSKKARVVEEEEEEFFPARKPAKTERNPRRAISYVCGAPDITNAELYFDSQKAKIKEFAKKSNLEITAFYEDDSDRLPLTHRPALLKILSSEKDAGVLIVDSVWCLTSHRTELRSFLETLDTEGIHLQAASYLMDANSQFLRRWYEEKDSIWDETDIPRVAASPAATGASVISPVSSTSGRSMKIAVGYACNMPDIPDGHLCFASQKTSIQKYAKTHGAELKNIYEDDSDRPPLMNRRGISLLLANEKDAGLLLVDSVCYLTSNPEDLRNFLEVLDKEGIRLQPTTVVMDSISGMVREWYDRIG